MNPTEAIHLASTLKRRALFGSAKLEARVVLGDSEKVAGTDPDTGRARWVYRVSARIVFSGGKTGEHSLDAWTSDAARVLAHWSGYVEANHWDRPAVGALVRFSSANARAAGGMRAGRVTKVGPKRAVVAFTYKHGGKSTVTLPFSALRFDPK